MNFLLYLLHCIMEGILGCIDSNLFYNRIMGMQKGI